MERGDGMDDHQNDEEKWSDLDPDVRRAMKKSAKNIIFWETAADKVGGLKVIVVAIGLIVSYATGFLDFVLGAWLEWRAK